VTALHGVEVVFAPSAQKGGRLEMKEVPGTEFEIRADLVILAMGFVHPVHAGLVQGLGVALTPQGTLTVDKDLTTSRPGLFCAGDASRGASLVVWAIYEGRRAAQAIDRYLMGSSELP
jgi:glutamate synthase (NADPH/NADH) small chain